MVKSKTKDTVVGVLATKPDILSTWAGTRVAIMTMEKSPHQKNQFYRIVAWNPVIIEFVEKYLGKGCHIRVSGEPEYYNTINQDGQEMFILELIAEKVALLSAPQELNITKPKDSGGAAP